jgi:hypothetical protein
MQVWKKLNKVFAIDQHSSWQNSHAMMPCVFQENEHLFRIYYSPRDILNQSRPASVLLDMKNFKFEDISKKPILDLGDLGCYDDCGVMPTCVVEDKGKLFMFYNGWSLGQKTPFVSYNGLAVSHNSGRDFIKLSKAPNALYRDEIDPFSTFAPFVLKVQNTWHMWYVSCVKWVINNGSPTHYYHIKYASSSNGLQWIREGQICIDFCSDFEYAIARPMVINENGMFKMWYSYRASDISDKYRIGYAESENATDWIRKDSEIKFDVSLEGWDSEMLCYAYIFDYMDNRYMLYNGNGYGKTGFGIAILEK